MIRQPPVSTRTDPLFPDQTLFRPKIGYPGAIIGLSGGIDSAVVLAVAVDALGADNVRTVMMPSRYTADISHTDAGDMAQRLGVRHEDIAIGPAVDAFEIGRAHV